MDLEMAENMATT